MEQKISIRPPKMSDLGSLAVMLNSLVDEKAMIFVQKKVTASKISIHFENAIKDKKMAYLVLSIDKEIMGRAKITVQSGPERHIGELSIYVKKEARGKGLGERLLREIIDKAVKKFDLKIITLTVYARNKIARSLYKKIGFEKIGIFKKGISHYGAYEDVILMAKYID